MRSYPSHALARQDQPVAHTHHEPAAAGRPAPGAPAPGAPAAAPAAGRDDPGELLAVLSYLGVIFFSFVPALVIYLVKGRSSGYVRYHAARAVNVSVAAILFDLSAAIAGALLALDSVPVALSLVVPVATALWLTIVAFLVRAALAAARGEQRELPGWLCVRVLN